MTTVERLRDVDELRRAAEQFGSSLNDDLERRDRDAVFDRSLWSRCAEYGVLGLPVPEPYGGSELDLPAVVEVLDGLGYGCRDNGLLFALGAQVWSVELPILQFGTDEQRERYLPRLVDGSIMGAHCVTESEAGSDGLAVAGRRGRVLPPAAVAAPRLIGAIESVDSARLIVSVRVGRVSGARTMNGSRSRR